MALYRGYGEGIVLHVATDLSCTAATMDVSSSSSYESMGVSSAVVGPYENRFVSIVTVENRKIVHWGNYMDSLSAMRALSTKI